MEEVEQVKVDLNSNIVEFHVDDIREIIEHSIITESTTRGRTRSKSGSRSSKSGSRSKSVLIFYKE